MPTELLSLAIFTLYISYLFFSVASPIVFTPANKTSKQAQVLLFVINFNSFSAVYRVSKSDDNLCSNFRTE